jgi:hypothetical protein
VTRTPEDWYDVAQRRRLEVDPDPWENQSTALDESCGDDEEALAAARATSEDEPTFVVTEEV